MSIDKSIVLFVDDEENVLTSLDRYLVRETYERRFARSGFTAIQLMEKEEVGVLVSDMRMPGMGGMELMRIVKERWPNTIRIALSAHVSSPQLLAAINSGEVYRYLTKPLQPVEEIRAQIRQAIELFELRRTRMELMTSLSERNRQLEEQLAKVKMLEGMLPICSTCKKIRDDQGYWQRIEQYISDHSDAVFSHGMCPACYALEIQKLEQEFGKEEQQ